MTVVEKMDRTIRITPVLQEYLQIPGMVKIHGNTVEECLDDLIGLYPEIRSWLYTRNDRLRVFIFLNNEEILAPHIKGNLGRTLDPADEIQILAILAEG